MPPDDDGDLLRILDKAFRSKNFLALVSCLVRLPPFLNHKTRKTCERINFKSPHRRRRRRHHQHQWQHETLFHCSRVIFPSFPM